MRQTRIGKNIEATPEFQDYFESAVQKLGRDIPTFSDLLVLLQAAVEKKPKRPNYPNSAEPASLAAHTTC